MKVAPATVSVRWRGGTLAFTAAHGDVVRVTPPEQLRGGEACWSPDELLAGAAAAAYALAVVDEAAHRELPLVDATLQAGCRVTALGGEIELIRIDAELETLPGYEEPLRDAALAAEHCRVHQALGVPVHVHLRVHAAEAARGRRAMASRA